MAPDFIWAGLADLALYTPGWTDEAMDGYAEQLTGCADPEVFAEAIHSIIHSWTDLFARPPIPVIEAAYDEALAARRPSALEQGRAHCNGSGWVTVVEHGEPRQRPCPRCNPILNQAFCDPQRWADYLNGVGLQDLDVDVERRRGELRPRHPVAIPRCSTVPELAARDDRGSAVVRRAYRQECDAQDREPLLLSDIIEPPSKETP